MSQPLPHAIVSHPIVLIVRTLLPTVPLRVCALLPSVVIVMILVPESPIVHLGLLFPFLLLF
jgi:hypothetical protein